MCRQFDRARIFLRTVEAIEDRKKGLSLHSTLERPFKRVKFNLSNCIDRYRPRFEIHSLYLCSVGEFEVERLNDIENNQKPV